jgi:hypothetical protein
LINHNRLACLRCLICLISLCLICSCSRAPFLSLSCTLFHSFRCIRCISDHSLLAFVSYPVVEEYKDAQGNVKKRLLGIVVRYQLIILLKHKIWGPKLRDGSTGQPLLPHKEFVKDYRWHRKENIEDLLSALPYFGEQENVSGGVRTLAHTHTHTPFCTFSITFVAIFAIVTSLSHCPFCFCIFVRRYCVCYSEC